MTFREAIDHVKATKHISLAVIAQLLGVSYTGIFLRYQGKAKGQLRLTTVIKFYKKFDIVLEPYTKEMLDDIIKAKS